MDKDQIVEIGNHAELLKKMGFIQNFGEYKINNKL